MSENQTPVQIPARRLFPPKTISEAAQAHLSQGAARPRFAWPPATEVETWRRLIRERDALFEPMAESLLANAGLSVAEASFGGVASHVSQAPAWDAASGTVVLYIHGGGFVFGGGAMARAQAAAHADRLDCLCVSVEYRMPPDHPFPAAPEDCVAVYRALLERYGAGRIVIVGASAGGNLAAAATLMLRDRGLPLPAGLVLLTPEVDLTEAGDSFRSNELLDVVLKGGLPECNALYAGDRSLDDPYLSPLYADLSGFPRTLVQSGTRDLFLSNAVLFHRRLRRQGVEAELHVWEAMPHGGFGGAAAEDAELIDEIRHFIAKCRAA